MIDNPMFEELNEFKCLEVVVITKTIRIKK